MNPPPLPNMPPPLPPYPSEQRALKSAFKAAGALVAALIVFGMFTTSDNPKPAPAPAVSDIPPAVRQSAAPCSAATGWKGKMLSANPSQAELRAWKAELDAKLSDPRWVQCMTDRYGALLDPAQ